MLFNLNFDFGDCFGLDVATMSGTVFLVLMHVAIALVYFFFALLASSYGLGKCKLNAPCPHPIVPFPKEILGQSAKTLLLSLLCGN
jgi:hypothetical protein